ncbi:hypothetical protein SOM46_09140 [Pseudomonas fluorescens]|uniref:hypothetical protein n=1 Tax=Pseudomonas fluorescens TaxID=294 RepID=UPI00177ACB3E|nr:hypothetical protein [Pseudomonas fluorescens]MBD8235671.1 hypothetical protein [Pseudomonas fluorescens]MDY0895115.1 hypothetical protein [Pseudomonas fluorescens]
MSITPLNIGSAPNDASGQSLRSGGQVINANFAELDTRTAEAQSKADAALPASQKGVASGVATLGSDGKLPVSQLPPLAINEVFTVATQAAMLALTAQRGDMAIRTDQAGQAYVLAADAPTVLANWIQIKQNLAVALVALGAVTPAADTIAYFNGTATATTAAFTAKARALLARSDTAGMQAELALVPVSSSQDATAGRLVTPGWMGLGSTLGIPLPGGNANQILPSGIYWTNTSWTGSPYTGTDPRNRGQIFVQPWGDATYQTQSFSPLFSAANNPKLERAALAGVWRGWDPVIGGLSALSDPANDTGGLMSSTVVSGYTVTKYASGIMNVLGPMPTTATLPANAVTTVDVTIPSGFISVNFIVPEVNIFGVTNTDHYGKVGGVARSATVMALQLRNGATSQALGGILSVWGRWK